MNWFLNSKIWLQQHPLIFYFLVLLLVAFVAHLATTTIYQFLFTHSRKKQYHWTEIILTALRKPLLVLIWYLAFIYGLMLLLQYTKDRLLLPLDTATSLGLLIICVWFLLRLIKKVETKLMQGELVRKTFDKTTVDGMIKLCKILLLAVAILSILQTLGVPLAAIYTAAGGAGIGITLAAQDVLKNIFGGLMLYFDRPFNIGDWISSPDKDIEGTVEKIGWRTTRLRTFDKRPLYVPNSTFLVVSVKNPSRMLHRRIRTDVGVRYRDFRQIPKITQDIETMLRQHPDITTKQSIWVNLVNFGPSSLDIRIYAFTKTKEWIPFQKIQQDVLLKVLDIITNHGAELAFPSRTLYVTKDLNRKFAQEKQHLPAE